ncbi:MAG: hypothetical protein ABL925_20425 [Methylococcales bacterium]
MLFELGKIVATPAVIEAMRLNNIDMVSLLTKHASGDWGMVCAEDKRENELSVKNGWRILSSYPLNTTGDKVWVITEADRSSTCFLLPDEY